MNPLTYITVQKVYLEVNVILNYTSKQFAQNLTKCNEFATMLSVHYACVYIAFTAKCMMDVPQSVEYEKN